MAQRGWRIVATIEDAGASAASIERPGMVEALEMLARGEAGTLAVAKLDRRSLVPGVRRVLRGRALHEPELRPVPTAALL